MSKSSKFFEVMTDTPQSHETQVIKRPRKSKTVSFRLSAAEYGRAMEVCECLGHESVSLLARSVLVRLRPAQRNAGYEAELQRVCERLKEIIEHLKSLSANTPG